MRDVILKACIPEQKLLTVKVIKETLGLGVKEVKESVDAIPSKIAERISNEKAERLREQFEKEGMKIEVRDSLTGKLVYPTKLSDFKENDSVAEETVKILEDGKEVGKYLISEGKPHYWIMGTPYRGDDVYDLLHDKDSLLQSKTDVNKQMLENPSRLLLINDIHEINAIDVEDNASLVNLITKNWTKLELPWKPKDKELVWAWDDDDACRRIVIFYDSKNNCTFSYEGKRYGHIFDNYAPFEGEYPEWAKEALKKLKD